MREKLQCLYENLMWNNFRAVNKTRIGLLRSDRIGLWIGSNWIGSDRTGIFAFGAEELFEKSCFNNDTGGSE